MGCQGLKVIALVTARAGSKGIPLKNMLRVGEETLVARSIRHGMQSKYVDMVAVSTDYPENCPAAENIINEALKLKAEIINRPPEICTSESKTEEAIEHAINHCKTSYRNHFDIMVVLQPTTPFRSHNLIDRAIEMIVDEDKNSVLGVSKFYNFLFYHDKGEVWSTFDYMNRPMRQTLSEEDYRYFDNGSVYVFKIDEFMKTKCRIMQPIGLLETSLIESMQIDSVEEYQLCRDLAPSLVDY
jgi:CMP-N-acetylneuraminic acid synthetase